MTTAMNLGPLTNSQIAARDAATREKFSTKDGAPAIPPVLSAYTYGPYELVWLHEGKAEVRKGDAILRSGTYAECKAWIDRQ